MQLKNIKDYRLSKCQRDVFLSAYNILKLCFEIFKSHGYSGNDVIVYSSGSEVFGCSYAGTTDP